MTYPFFAGFNRRAFLKMKTACILWGSPEWMAPHSTPH